MSPTHIHAVSQSVTYDFGEEKMGKLKMAIGDGDDGAIRRKMKIENSFVQLTSAFNDR